METHLADWLKGTADGAQAEAILRNCVHCGFCTATCPTYQILGDELDGPRGRIYLIKQVVEGAQPTAATLTHLDRCLTCRNCESTCPSGVKYGHLVDIGRKLVEEKVDRPLRERALRWALRETLTRRWIFDPAMRVGKALRPLLPAALKTKVPQARPVPAWPTTTHPRRVLMLDGCVQPAMEPGIDAATARVLDRLGVTAVRAPGSGCCGAIRHHLNDHDGALADARRNIDAWWPQIEPSQGGTDRPGVEAILINASGCGAMVKDYAHLLRNDPAYAEKARRVVDLARDPVQWLTESVETLRARVKPERVAAQVLAFHPPCTLQHGQQIRGAVESMLTALGARLVPVAESHLCCGSAGTYSVTQPELSRTLRDRKLANLQAGSPQMILSANIGCLVHLQSGTGVPVRHWIEWLDQVLA
jgi:glycolate oxidase iron-sulfur subunit